MQTTKRICNIIAELYGIQAALPVIEQSHKEKFTVYSDSQPCRLQDWIGSIHLQYKNVELCLCPGHVGISGNERDVEAKSAISASQPTSQPASHTLSFRLPVFLRLSDSFFFSSPPRPTLYAIYNDHFLIISNVITASSSVTPLSPQEHGKGIHHIIR